MFKIQIRPNSHYFLFCFIYLNTVLPKRHWLRKCLSFRSIMCNIGIHVYNIGLGIPDGGQSGNTHA